MSDRPGFLSIWQLIFAFLYLLAGGFAAWQTIGHTNAEAYYFDQVCAKQSIGNEGAQVIARHGLVGSIFASQMNLGLPSTKTSTQSLGEIPHLQQLENQEAVLAPHWSWILVGLSLVYLAIAAVLPGTERMRNILFALTNISTIAFLIGISASAMKVFTVIHNFFGTTPVVQHEVRSIYSVIDALFSSGHWIFAGFLTLFSVVTPAIKIGLTFTAGMTSSESVNSKISKLLGEIGKWSMSDVFVGAVLLSFFVIQSGQATRVVPCRGLYYFAAYCLLSMVTTELLRILNFQGAPQPASKAVFSLSNVGSVVGVVLFLSAIASLKK